MMRDKYRENPEKHAKAKRISRQSNPENALESNRKSYQKYKDERLEQKKKYYQENKGRIRDYQREYENRKMKEDSFYAFKIRMRGVVRDSFRRKGYGKTSQCRVILGCDYETLFNHIESQFRDGMNWDNKGEWHIDHIKPLALAKTEEDVAELCHYTNLQPLWCNENLSKGSKYD